MKFISRKHLSKCYFYLGGDQPYVTWLERLRASTGVLAGLFAVIAVAKLLGDWMGVDQWLMASLGASALLVFVLPGSPMAQPWAVIAGNALSGFVGVSVLNLIHEPLFAMPIAASLSVMLMFVFRCLHPPASAVSLIVVLAQITHYDYVFFPVIIDSVILVLAAAIYSRMTGKLYPNRSN